MGAPELTALQGQPGQGDLPRPGLVAAGTGAQRQRRGLQLIGYAFAALAVYLLVQSTVVVATAYHPRHSALGIIWTANPRRPAIATGRTG